MKALYDQLFLKDEEIPEFKKKMNNLQEELGFRVEGTREKEARKINKLLKERAEQDEEKRKQQIKKFMTTENSENKSSALSEPMSALSPTRK